MAGTGASLPELPPLPPAAEAPALQDESDAGLERLVATLQEAERATLAAMAPYDRQLREIRARLGEISTERRRRERAAQVAQRAGVRQAAKTGGMPSLAAALEGDIAAFGEETPLVELRAFLSTGGQVGLGFATRPGTIAFSDGRRQQVARTWGEARELHAAGWEPGTPGIPGVRVHLAGSRVERVVPATDIVLDVAGGGAG